MKTRIKQLLGGFFCVRKSRMKHKTPFGWIVGAFRLELNIKETSGVVERTQICMTTIIVVGEYGEIHNVYSFCINK